MTQIVNLNLSFPPSPTPDVTYRLYVQEGPDPVTYNSEMFDLGANTEVDLGTLPGMTTKDGIYNLGVVAVDAAGNQSSMQVLEGVQLDFVAPDPPGELVLTRS